MRRAAAAIAMVTIAAGSLPEASAEEPRLEWAPRTASPVPTDGAPADAVERDALSRCGPADAGLVAVARAIVARKLGGAPIPSADELEILQRAAGEPHPWASEWATTGQTTSTPAALKNLDEWLADRGSLPRLRRCGVAAAVAKDGNRILAVVTVDALADLASLPLRARTGQWVSVDARLRVQASGGKVVVLGPNGAPRSLPTAFDGHALHARFPLDQPGEFAVQVMADVAAGPRPVLEASVFADVEPPAHPADRTAPGEDACDATPGAGDDASLALMLAAARVSAGVPPLGRDARLDAIAHDHAVRLAARHELAHDAGDGSPVDRLWSAGLDVRDAGENVAHASTLALTHRALWISPSHRTNTLRRDVDRVGLGVARDERGEPWVVELFVGGLGGGR